VEVLRQDVFDQLLDKEKINSDFVYTEGEARINITVVGGTVKKNKRVMGVGPDVTVKYIKQFKQKYEALLKKSYAVVLSGKKANGTSDEIYAQLIRLAQKYDVLVVLDASEEALIKGLKAKPDMISPNLAEAQKALNQKLNSMNKIKEGIAQFHKMGIKIVLLTLGNRGAICSNGINLWHCQPPTVKIIHDVGCGDAFLGGFLYSYLKGASFRSAVGMASACGSANGQEVIPGLISKKNVLQLLKRIKVKKL